MRTALALLFVLWGSWASAQSSKDRVDAIWVIASNRMLTQQDAWFEDGDFPACISLLKVEAEKWPSDYEIWTNLGWMEENVQDYPEALQTYIRYRKLNPQDPDSSLPEGTYYYMKKEYERVPAILEGSIKKKCHPNNFRVLAWSYEREKKFTDAVRVWKVMLSYFPTDAQAQRNVARDEKKAALPSS